MTTSHDDVDTATAPETDAYQGMVVFWHLRTPDIERARSFYRELFGWQFQEVNPLTSAIQNKGGIMGCLVASEEPAGAVPGSVLYIHVTDLHETVKRAVELGAEVVSEPLHLYGTKAFADLRDPTGSVFGLWTESFSPA
jgi:uncharacterized protein